MARKIVRQVRRGFGQYDEGEVGEEGPAPEDYTITPCGPLGSRTCAGQVEGKFLGEFKDDDAALRAICDKMDREQWWPGVWSVSDHGNVEPIDPKCSRFKPKARRKKR